MDAFFKTNLQAFRRFPATQVFFFEICEIFKNNFFCRRIPVAASAVSLQTIRSLKGRDEMRKNGIEPFLNVKI